MENNPLLFFNPAKQQFVVGGEQVRSGAQRRLLVRLRKQDVELPGQLVEEQAVEEGVLLLAPGTEFQGLLGCEGREVEELLNPPNVCQLVRS
jgi:hypothetical protein